MSAHDVQIDIVATKEGSAFDRVAQAVLLGHGRIILTITRPDGTLFKLDCLDMDRLTRVEYDAWSKQ